MTHIPEWIVEWIQKDRLVRNKFKISKSYLRQSKRIHFVEGEQNIDNSWKSFYYRINSPKYGSYNVTYENGIYHCNCPFFKHRLICSHILGVCQYTGVWPDKETIFGK